jgi:hypothetical protein
MPPLVPQLEAPARRLFVLGLCLASLAGCQSLGGSSSLARLRVIDLSADAGAVDIYYQGNNAIAYNLSYGAVTSYVPIAPGGYTMTVDLAGSKQALSAVKGVFSAGGQYTVLIHSPAASMQQLILADQVPLAASGPYLRFVHQAVRSGAVDVYCVPAGQRLASAIPVVTNLAPGTSTGYLAIPAGTCTAVMLPAGATPSSSAIALHTGTQIDYASGSARSLILLDAQPSLTGGMQVIATVDALPVN